MEPAVAVKTNHDLLTIVQKDCLRMRGECAGCYHGQLISSPCQVKYSEGVAERLGLPIKRRMDPKRKKVVDTLPNCRCCGKVFSPVRSRQVNCTPCLNQYGSGATTITCKGCGVRAIVKQVERLYCPDCNPAAKKFHGRR